MKVDKKPSYGAKAVVTGAGSGIGKAFALEVARRGGEVVCADINSIAADSTVAQIKKMGGKALALKCDVSKLRDVETLALRAERFFGSDVSLVINNAGIGTGGTTVGEVSLDDWKTTLDINLWGVVHGCHVFAPKLRASGRGGIINVASTAGFAAAPMMGPYNVSKAGVVALSETMAAELAGSGVRITALCPTFVKTNIVANGLIDTKTSSFAQRVMDMTGMSADKVARIALDGYDSGKLYVLPQLEARAIWRAKRLLPAIYAKGAGLVKRMTPEPVKSDSAAPKLVVNK